MSKPKVNEAKLATKATVILTTSFMATVLVWLSPIFMWLAELVVLIMSIKIIKTTKQKNTELQAIIALIVSGFWWGILIFAFVFGFIIGLSGGDIIF